VISPNDCIIYQFGYSEITQKLLCHQLFYLQEHYGVQKLASCHASRKAMKSNEKCESFS
jgi:hypothetical protein